MGMDAMKHDVFGATNGAPARQVLLAISRGDDIALAAKEAVAAAAAPGSRVLVVHLAELRPSLLDSELGEQRRTSLASAIELIEAAGIPASGVVARPGQAGRVVAAIAEEWHADMTVMGSSPGRDLATMFLGRPS